MSETTTPDIAPLVEPNVTPDVIDTARPSPIQTLKDRRAAKAQESKRMSDPKTVAPAAPVQQTLPVAPTAPAVPQEILAELSALRAEKDARAKQDEEFKVTLAKAQEQIGATEKQRAELAEANRSLKIQSAVRLAAMEHGAVDPDDVTMLLSGKLTLDESGAVIAADDTKAKASDYVKGFLEKKPHLAARRVATGSGAPPFPSQGAPTSAPIDLSTADGMTEFARRLTLVPQKTAAKP